MILNSRSLKSAIVVAATLVAGVAVADQQYLIESELWLEGRLTEVPVMIVASGEAASMSPLTGSGEPQWRLEIEVERAAEHLMSPGDALWIHVSVRRKTDDEWEHLTDTILGVPEGERATLSIVDGGIEATPENSDLYLRVRTSRLRPLEESPQAP